MLRNLLQGNCRKSTATCGTRAEEEDVEASPEVGMCDVEASLSEGLRACGMTSASVQLPCQLPCAPESAQKVSSVQLRQVALLLLVVVVGIVVVVPLSTFLLLFGWRLLLRLLWQ
jgi:hypothetical protein